ncbi:MAG TPA: T9SS type A sorting domain-containing protein [Chitinophagaceae bacterium]|nr:T9SS type A sorting domain-containing protein [Chitinophagaceae bacterium]
MLKIYLIVLSLTVLMVNSYAQLCPGGGTNSSNSVTVAQSWFYNCETGTSCNGGTNFDNRPACEPNLTMDACAPAPSCTNNDHDQADIWFNFIANGTSATINVLQNVSFVVAIQAFSGGPTCGSFTEIGCAKAAGPSSGVTLTLTVTGLTINQTYYFRIFGSAPPNSQRTGVYCFCGSSGLGSQVVPVVLTSFKATVQKKNHVVLNWITASESKNRYFDVEQSNDGINFSFVSRIAGKGNTSSTSYYTATDSYVTPGTKYYRLKQVDMDGKFTYSGIISIFIEKTNRLNITQQADQLIVESEENMQVALLNSSGRLISYFTLKPGRNNISLSNLPVGMYLLRNNEDAGSWRFNKTY